MSRFPQAKPTTPPPQLSELNDEERDAWHWMTSGTDFDCHVINLTPRLARLLMTRVGDNRKPKLATISRYARAISSKQWQLTHQGIGISTRFEVIDGQHRIQAVIEANTMIEVLVVRGVSQDAMLVLDSGVVRSDADAIRISDIGLRDLEAVEASGAKRMMRGARQFMKAVSREDLRKFIIRHRAPIKLIYAALWKDGRIPNITHSEILAVLARASYHCPPDDLMAVVTFLATGKSEGDSDRYEPLLALREWLIKATTKQLKHRYGKTSRAVQAFINREKLGRRLAESREEIFPLPEEERRDDDL